MNHRIFIEKKQNFDIESQKKTQELQQLFPKSHIKVYIIYDIFNASIEEINKTKNSVFCDTVVDVFHEKLIFETDKKYLATEYIPGQYDQRADSAEQAFKLITENNHVIIKTGKLFEISQVDQIQLEKIKNFIINPVDSKEKNLNNLLLTQVSKPKSVELISDFINFSEIQLTKFYTQNNFSFEFNDLVFIQNYFQQENRNPTETELKVLDTYWSDHCRHTTFLTELTDFQFEGDLKNRIEQIFQQYITLRENVGRKAKPITLMDIATICTKHFQQQGKLNDVVISDEINACTIDVTIEVDGKPQQWELLFKNETHNHPTEIEPFGGASTCIGGAIRDPLSGRAFIYQAMRVTGSANPLEKYEDTLEGKLPQRKITQEAANGYSSYGNQIGIPTSHISEIYHEGYKAKRMEVGMVVGAVPKHFVRRETPKAGDKVIVFGGKTGRDGVGGATGSSKVHSEESIQTMSSEVQKGDAVQERKLQRFFRNEKVTQLIKKSNDFGAGGVSVAIGEIADGLSINLNLLPTKYDGLNGTELALSESQERMAVVVEEKDVAEFISLAEKENVLAVVVAEVTDNHRLEISWNDEKIVSLDRDFLDTSGVQRKQKVTVQTTTNEFPYQKMACNELNFKNKLQELNITSQKGLQEMFDSTVGKSTVLMPLGGKTQLTPADATVHTFPILNGKTNDVSMASWGFCPEISSWSQLHGGAFAVVESIAKIVSTGGDYKKVRLSFQEYFERLGHHPEKWGKPLQSLLGAYEAQMNFETAAIGGKDSMSGTYNEINVPPTLISFAVATEKITQIISPEIKKSHSFLYIIKHSPDEIGMPNYEQLKRNFEFIYQHITSNNILSAKHIKYGGIACELFKMCIGNQIGAEIQYEEDVFKPQIGSILMECKEEISFDNAIYLGKTTVSNTLIINNQKFILEDLTKAYLQTLTSVFPIVDSENVAQEIQPVTSEQKNIYIKNKNKANPHVLLPIFPGTNCEYETEQAFIAEDAQVDSFIFNNLNGNFIQQSIDYFSEQLQKSQILVFSGGFSAGDEPDGSAKYIVSILKSPQIKDSVHKFLQNDGLILGICNGFQALVKSGLLPYGSICELEENSPTLTFNSIGRHINQIAKIKVVSDKSIWLDGMKNKEYNIPFSHGEGRFFADEKTINQLQKEGQIATQYINDTGGIALQMPYNPNGSVMGIEGISDASGKIYGRMGHPERYVNGLLKNIPDMEYMNIFGNGVSYFK